jgi:hypothetical protein
MENLENWKTWAYTKLVKQIFKEVDVIVCERPRVTIYKVVPTIGWPNTHLGSLV